MMAIVVTGLAVTAVKGTRLLSVPQIELERDGARGDRRFFLIDHRGRMVNGKQIGELSTVLASYADGDQRRLTLTFPDGRAVESIVELGDRLTARFYSATREVRLVEGPWSAALSDFLARPVRLVLPPEGGVDRGARGGASLISRASLARLADAAGERSVDGRRFRMLIEIDGVDAHAEDGWVDRRARVGGAVVRWFGHVGRCLITTRHPETGEVDLPTLDIIREYRGALHTTEPLPFGIYGEVSEPGAVRVGDVVTLDG